MGGPSRGGTLHRRHIVALAAAACLAAACSPASGGGATPGPSGGASTSATPTPSPTPTPTATATPTPTPTEPPDPCARENLDLYAPGVLTVATGKPAYPPFFAENDPTNGRGFESAVAYAVAEQLGFSPDEVDWRSVSPEKALDDGAKKFDFAIGQYEANLTDRLNVSFSAPYYSVRQAIVALADSPAANVTSVAELGGLTLAVLYGSDAGLYVATVVQPSKEVRVLDDLTAVKSAVEAGEVDAVILDLPTAYSVTANDIPRAKIVGELPTVEGAASFGLLLEKGNPLSACLDEAIGTLAELGTLEALEEQWLAGDVVPKIAG